MATEKIGIKATFEDNIQKDAVVLSGVSGTPIIGRIVG